MKWGLLVIFLVIITLAVGARVGSVFSIEMIDPHTEPSKCNSCHSRNPTEEDVRSGELYLLAGTIDDTCHICHPYDCCRLYSLKGHNHPSNVSKWDVEKFTKPETLPLYEGMITCNTCHYHRRADVSGLGYKMVRLAVVELDMVDWTKLCNDCHINY